MVTTTILRVSVLPRASRTTVKIISFQTATSLSQQDHRLHRVNRAKVDVEVCLLLNSKRMILKILLMRMKGLLKLTMKMRRYQVELISNTDTINILVRILILTANIIPISIQYRTRKHSLIVAITLD